MNNWQDAATVLEEARIAYLSGQSADFVQGRVDGVWEAVFTIAPNSVTAAEAAGRHLLRSRAERVRHIRRARLIYSPTEEGVSIEGYETVNASATESVMLTELPNLTQLIVALEDGRTIKVRISLKDAVLIALLKAFHSTNKM